MAVLVLCVCAGPDPPHGYSDSSEMVKTIVQTVQNQDRILRDLYTHLRYTHTHSSSTHAHTCTPTLFSFSLPLVSQHPFLFLSLHLLPSSKILECKRRIVALFPKLEGAVESIKAAEAAVMTMQMKRQREFWHLLKIACVSKCVHKHTTPVYRHTAQQTPAVQCYYCCHQFSLHGWEGYFLNVIC